MKKIDKHGKIVLIRRVGEIFMNNVFYDERKVKEIMKIFKKIDRHFENSCIWVTNIKEKATWCSEKTRELFNTKTEYV